MKRLREIVEPMASALYQHKKVRAFVRFVTGGPTYKVNRGGKEIYTARLQPTDTHVRTRGRVH